MDRIQSKDADVKYVDLVGWEHSPGEKPEQRHDHRDARYEYADAIQCIADCMFYGTVGDCFFHRRE